MKAAIIQHEKSVTAGTTIDWLQSRQIPFKIYSLDENPELPDTTDFDLLVICGGTMDVDQENIYPWLSHEKKLIQKVILQKKPVVGLCLGAQLLAEALGAKVGQHDIAEIGWHNVNLSDSETQYQSLTVFQWHFYAFELPKGCTRTATNKICLNQGFRRENNLLAYQFHPEATLEWILKCADDSDLPAPSETIQSSEKIKSDLHFQAPMQSWYFSQLDSLIKNNQT